MPLPALVTLEKQFEKQIRLFELKKNVIERKIGQQIRLFEIKKGAFERKIEQQFETQKQKFEFQRKRIEQKFELQKKKIETHFRRFEEKKVLRLDDEVRFIRTWIEKPLALGAVTPSGKALARTMAGYLDPEIPGPIVELGPGTGPVTEAIVEQGIDPARLVLVEFDPTFCRLLQARFPAATVVQGDAYSLRRTLTGGARPAGGRGGVRTAAVHQAAHHAAAPHPRGVRADAAGRAVRAVHLCDRPADPEGARPRALGGVRAGLDEHSAGARVGLP